VALDLWRGGSGVASDPTVLLTAGGTIAVYVTNTDGGVSGASQGTPGGAISSWQQLGGTNLVGKPAAAQFPNGTIGLYTRTTDGRVEAAGQSTAGGAFSPWTTIGGGSGRSIGESISSVVATASV
jgi:hypothetical protein